MLAGLGKPGELGSPTSDRCRAGLPPSGAQRAGRRGHQRRLTAFAQRLGRFPRFICSVRVLRQLLYPCAAQRRRLRPPRPAAQPPLSHSFAMWHLLFTALLALLTCQASCSCAGEEASACVREQSRVLRIAACARPGSFVAAQRSCAHIPPPVPPPPPAPPAPTAGRRHPACSLSFSCRLGHGPGWPPCS